MSLRKAEEAAGEASASATDAVFAAAAGLREHAGKVRNALKTNAALPHMAPDDLTAALASLRAAVNIVDVAIKAELGVAQARAASAAADVAQKGAKGSFGARSAAASAAAALQFNGTPSDNTGVMSALLALAHVLHRLPTAAVHGADALLSFAQAAPAAAGAAAPAAGAPRRDATEDDVLAALASVYLLTTRGPVNQASPELDELKRVLRNFRRGNPCEAALAIFFRAQCLDQWRTSNLGGELTAGVATNVNAPAAVSCMMELSRLAAVAPAGGAGAGAGGAAAPAPAAAAPPLYYRRPADIGPLFAAPTAALAAPAVRANTLGVRLQQISSVAHTLAASPQAVAAKAAAVAAVPAAGRADARRAAEEHAALAAAAPLSTAPSAADIAAIEEDRQNAVREVTRCATHAAAGGVNPHALAPNMVPQLTTVGMPERFSSPPLLAFIRIEGGGTVVDDVLQPFVGAGDYNLLAFLSNYRGKVAAALNPWGGSGQGSRFVVTGDNVEQLRVESFSPALQQSAFLAIYVDRSRVM